MLCVLGELLWYLQLCTLPAIFTSPHQCWRDYVRLAICSYHCKKLKCDLHPLNSKNNGPILLLKTICAFGHWRCFLSYVATDGKDSKSICFKNHQKIMMVSDPCLISSYRSILCVGKGTYTTLFKYMFSLTVIRNYTISFISSSICHLSIFQS